MEEEEMEEERVEEVGYGPPRKKPKKKSKPKKKKPKKKSVPKACRTMKALKIGIKSLKRKKVAKLKKDIFSHVTQS